MPTIKNPLTIGSGSNNVVNGILGEYLANGEEVLPNTFVDVLATTAGLVRYSTTGGIPTTTGTAIDTIQVAPGILFTVFRWAYSGSTYKPAVFMSKVGENGLEFSGDPIDVSSTTVDSTHTFIPQIKITQLATNKVIVVWKTDTTYPSLCAAIINFNIATLEITSVGPTVQIVSGNSDRQIKSISAVLKVREDAVVVSYLSGLGTSRKYQALSISSSTITSGPALQLTGDGSSPLTIVASDGKLLGIGWSVAVVATLSPTLELTIDSEATLSGQNVSRSEPEDSNVGRDTFAVIGKSGIYLYGDVFRYNPLSSSIECVSSSLLATVGNYARRGQAKTGKTTFSAVASLDPISSTIPQEYTTIKIYEAMYDSNTQTISYVSELNSTNAAHIILTPPILVGGSLITTLSYDYGNNKTSFQPAFLISGSSVRIIPAKTMIKGLTKTKATTTQPGKVWLLNNGGGRI